MRSRRPGPRGPASPWRLAAGWLAACLLATGARAQSLQGPGFATQSAGIPWGPMTLHPTLVLNYGYDDNIFYESNDLSTANILASREGQIQPGVRFDMPFGESYLRGGYAALYRNYSTDQYTPTSQWSHYFDLDGKIRAGARIYFNLRDRFVRGTEELRVIDPGGELAFGDLPFRSHTPSVEAGVDLGARQSVSAVWSYNSSQFQESDEVGVFNYRGYGLQARYNYKLSAESSAYLYYGADTMTQVRDTEQVEYAGKGEGIGFTQVLSRAVTTSVTAGYQVLDASGAVESAYHGPTITGNASWLIGDATRLNFTIRRVPYQSFYLNNSYYLNRSFTVEAMHQVGLSSYWRLVGAYEQNRYSDPLNISGFESIYCRDDGDGPICPSKGVVRRDTAWRAEAGFGVQISRIARWYVGYNWQSRSTNLLQADVQGFGDPFSYDVNRYFFRIEVGWL